jgi:hypothetical protein
VRSEQPAFAPPLPAQVEAGGIRDWQIREQHADLLKRAQGLNVGAGIGGANYAQGLQTTSGMNVNYLDAPAGTFNYSGAQLSQLTSSGSTH